MPDVIRATGLVKYYGGLFPWQQRKVIAVDGVDLNLPAGEICGLLGPNGAGKTTTVKMLAGLILPDHGTIDYSGSSQRPPMGAVLEGNRNLYWRLSLWENLSYFGTLKGVASKEIRRQADELLPLFSLADKRHASVQQLSRGMQQKLAIVTALLGAPTILLLDEPTLGLDVESSIAIQKLLKELCTQRGVSILVTTHQMDVAQNLCKSVMIMRQGKIVLNQRVDELVDIFKRQDFFARFDAALLPKLAPLLERAGIGYELTDEQREGQVSLRFQLAESSGIYTLMQILKDSGVELLDFRQEVPTLEEIFLSVTGSQHAPSSGANTAEALSRANANGGQQ